ncbi:response regulator [Halorientalis salina]|uniref:response regulator n=1 Tax=Halorientalis salina TaxID=2932266 RepID=UPI0010ABC0A5|nr:response regulator [Halorientalis salina]
MGVASPGENHDDERSVMVVANATADADIVSCGLEDQSVSMVVVPDGQKAIERLSAGSADHTDEGVPDLILLDFAVESPAGTTVLDAIKSSPLLGAVPVVVLTDDEDSVATAYELGANAHVTKPHDADEYAAVVESTARFWFEWAQFPSEPLCTDRSLFMYD